MTKTTEPAPLVERLRTDVLWHQRRGNDTIARDCQEAADAITKAEHAAVSAIYLADNSDYLPALWSIVRALDPAMAELLERDESAAYDKSHERTNGAGPNYM